MITSLKSFSAAVIVIPAFCLLRSTTL